MGAQPTSWSQSTWILVGLALGIGLLTLIDVDVLGWRLLRLQATGTPPEDLCVLARLRLSCTPGHGWVLFWRLLGVAACGYFVGFSMERS